jgi:hypothetical protein
MDRGAKRVLKAMKARPVVRVGVMGDEAAAPKKSKTGGTSVSTVIDVATIHEFGIGVPRRSFIADWADESITDSQRRLRKAANRINKKGADLEMELERFGLWAVGEIQKRISRGISPDISEETKKRKGSNIPLIDTGQLRSSITHLVMMKRAA